MSNESIPTNSENVKSDGKATAQEIVDLFKGNNNQLKTRAHRFYFDGKRIRVNNEQSAYSLDEFIDLVNNSEDARFDFFRQDIIKKNRAEAEKTKEQETTKAEQEEQKESSSTSNNKIDDFGEKIGGARKDIYAYRKQLAEGLEKDISNEDVFHKKMSELFPDFNYDKLKKEGMDYDSLLLLKMLHNIAMGELSDLRKKVVKHINNEDYTRTFLRDYSRIKLFIKDVLVGKPFENIVKFEKMMMTLNLYRAIGYDNLNSILKNLRIMDYRGYETAKGNVNGVLKDVNWGFEINSGKVRIKAYGENDEEVISEFVRKYNEQVLERAAESKNVKFDIYLDRNNRTHFIGKKVSWNDKKYYRFSKEFKTAKEALEYRDSNYDEIFNEYETERKERNAPPEPYEKTATERIGEDYRNGEDVTPEKFAETFGFRGVEFGNYVEGKRRQQDLNQAYDALMDLANLLGIDPKALSLNGELGLAFGARGRGGKNAAMAHYEPGNRVINLTKGKGAGTIAHEWWHGLMNYFTGFQIEIGSDMKAHGKDSSDLADHEYHRKKYADRNAYYRKQETVRPDNMNVEAFDALVQLMTVINDDTKIIERSSDYNTSNNNYWTSTREVTARAFDNYVKYKLNQQEKNNSFLSMASFNSDVNPTLEEMPKLAEAYDKFFKSLKQEKSERKGKETIKLYSFVDPFTFLWLNRKYIAKGLKKTYNILKEGVELFGKGVKSISQWAKSMYDKFGKSINKFYKEIHKDIKAVFSSKRLFATSIDTTPKNHTNEENKRIKEYVNSVDPKIYDFVLKYKNNPNEKFSNIKLGELTENEKKLLKNVTGSDFDNYSLSMNKNAVIHILRRHGEKGIHDHTMKEPADIARLKYVMENADSCSYSYYENGNQRFSNEFKNQNGENAPTVEFIKKIDGKHHVISAVPENKSKTIWVVSSYLTNKKDGFTQVSDATSNGSPDVTPKAGLAYQPSYDSSINKSTKNVNNTHNGKLYSVEYLVAETATKIIKWGYEKAEDVAKKLAKYMYDTYTKIKDAYGKVKYSQWSNLVNDISDEHKKEIFKDIEKDIKKEENKKKNYKPIPSDQYEFDAYLEREWEKQPKRISDKNVVQLSSEETYNKGVEEGKRQAKAETK